MDDDDEALLMGALNTPAAADEGGTATTVATAAVDAEDEAEGEAEAKAEGETPAGAPNEADDDNDGSVDSGDDSADDSDDEPPQQPLANAAITTATADQQQEEEENQLDKLLNDQSVMAHGVAMQHQTAHLGDLVGGVREAEHAVYTYRDLKDSSKADAKRLLDRSQYHKWKKFQKKRKQAREEKKKRKKKDTAAAGADGAAIAGLDDEEILTESDDWDEDAVFSELDREEEMEKGDSDIEKMDVAIGEETEEDRKKRKKLEKKLRKKEEKKKRKEEKKRLKRELLFADEHREDLKRKRKEPKEERKKHKKDKRHHLEEMEKEEIELEGSEKEEEAPVERKKARAEVLDLKKKKMSEIEKRNKYKEVAIHTINLMQTSTQKDLEALHNPSAGVPPLFRISALPEVLPNLRRAYLHESLLDSGFLDAVGPWLCSLEKGWLAPLNLREAMLDVLLMFEIEGVDTPAKAQREREKKGKRDSDATDMYEGITQEQLKSSDIGKRVNFIRLHPQELPHNHEKTITLLERFSRAFHADSNLETRPREVKWAYMHDKKVASPFTDIKSHSEHFMEQISKVDPFDPTSYMKLPPKRLERSYITTLFWGQTQQAPKES